MIEETLRRLEMRIRATSPKDAAPLLKLVAELRTELHEMEPGDAETVRKAAAEATGDPDHRGMLDDTLLDLETSHPRVVGLLRSLSQTLSDAGI